MSERLDPERLLYGPNPRPGLVAVEPAPAGVRLFARDGLRVSAEVVPFEPWILLPEGAPVPAGAVRVERLEGGDLNCLVRFLDWSTWRSARTQLARETEDFLSPPSPAEQFLVAAGGALFYGLHFDDLVRVALDIESSTLDPTAPGARVLAAALRDNRGTELVLGIRGEPEAQILADLTRALRRLDPDIIQGHNIFAFDLPYLVARAEALRVSLDWGRDGSAVKVSSSARQYRVGPKAFRFLPARVYGRHVVDTMHLVHRYDAGGELESYSLKAVLAALGIGREGRTTLHWTEIGVAWEKDPVRLAEYVLDDVRDVEALAQLLLPTDFYQAQIVPHPFEDVTAGGTGEKINSLMVRAYLAMGRGIPRPEPAVPYPGGYTELRQAGIFGPVVKVDIESLYPSIMLAFNIGPARDQAGVFLTLLRVLTERRLEAKERLRSARGAEWAYWNGWQAALKRLINSFYGYLGYARANFNDYEAAARVTQIGQDIIKQVVAWLEEAGATVIEVDTDGAYFVPPPGTGSDFDRELVAGINRRLPPGIRLAWEGRFAGMLALKAKNYILLTEDGSLVVKGSGLRSRRDERFLRQFAEEVARALFSGGPEAAAERYRFWLEQVESGTLTPEDFARLESVTPKTFTSPNLRRLAQAAAGKHPGERVMVYQRADGSLAPIEAYAGDEDRAYLKRRLYDMALRFRPLFKDPAEFDRLFPKPTVKPARSVPAGQLRLF
ncbi:MAG: DNA polymerase [Chloroflexota bacterium]